jgi:hypothetical protein
MCRFAGYFWEVVQLPLLRLCYRSTIAFSIFLCDGVVAVVLQGGLGVAPRLRGVSGSSPAGRIGHILSVGLCGEFDLRRTMARP